MLFNQPIMNKILSRSLSLMCALYLLGSCKKSTAPLTEPNAQVSFYHASYILSLMISDAKGSHQAPLILDNNDSDYVPPAQGAATQALPAFDSRSSNNIGFQFPNNGTNAGILQPWILYMQINPGAHSLLLVDTNLVHRRKLVTTSFTATTDVPQTIWFADSLGVFKTVISMDEQVLIQDSIRIRLAHFSPDAGRVFLTVNKQQSFFDSTDYGMVSAYRNYPLTDAARLSIQLRSSADTTQVLARTILNAAPGRSYTLLLKGYNTGGQAFKDPDGNTILTNPNIGLSANTSY
jgi:hypothetical protein